MYNKKRIAKTVIALMTSALFIQAVPAHADSVHVAKEGDTFYTLSKQYGVAMNTIMNANQNISPYNIYGGLKITIPNASVNKEYKTEVPFQIDDISEYSPRYLG